MSNIELRDTPRLAVLARGKQYPRAISTQEGAAAHFLTTSGNVLQIGLRDIARSEELAIRHGPMKAGFVKDGPAIILVFAFGTVVFESPFDARLIPLDLLRLPDISNSSQRLYVEVHLVDTAKNTLKGLRGVTLPPSLTLGFLAAVQDQIADPRNADVFFDSCSALPIEKLLQLANPELCGV